MKGWTMTDELTIVYMKARAEAAQEIASLKARLVEAREILHFTNQYGAFPSDVRERVKSFLCQADASAKGEASAAQAPSQIARPLDEWHEDMGPVIWWFFPMTEAPYVGSPLDCGAPVEVVTRYYEKCKVVEKLTRHNVGGWPGYHTHWTPMPQLPRQIEDPSEADNV
jgi:hypothetical protein